MFTSVSFYDLLVVVYIASMAYWDLSTRYGGKLNFGGYAEPCNNTNNYIYIGIHSLGSKYIKFSIAWASS